MIAVPFPPGFVASIEDTACAAPVNEPEYSYLITRLDQLVMPALWQGMLQLHTCGFKPSQVSRHEGLASMVVQREDPATSAWLYFQIHRSLGPAPDNECVFWMYAIHHPAGTTAGRPGRLALLEEPDAVEAVVATFVQACAETPQRRNLFTAPARTLARAHGKELTRPSARRPRGVFASA